MGETIEANSFRIASDGEEPLALLTINGGGDVVFSSLFYTLTPEQQAAALANTEADV